MANVKRQIRIGLLIMPGAIGLQLLAFLLIANRLGPRDFGVYSVIFAIMTICTLATEMGIGTIVIKAVAEDNREARNYIAIAWPGIALASLIAAVVQIAAVFSFYSVEETWVATLMACLNVLVFGLSMVLSCALRGLGHIEQWYVGFFSQKLLALLMVLGFLGQADPGLGFAMAVWPLSSIVVLLYYVRCLWREDWAGELRWSPQELKDLVKRSLPVGLTAAAYRASSQIEVFILAAFAGAAEVGLYVIGQRLLNPAGSVLRGAVVMPTFPGLCKLAVDGSPELGHRVSRLGIVHWLAAMGIAVGVWALAPTLIPLFLDPGFNDSIWVVQIAIWALGPYLISLQLRYLYVALSAQSRYLRLTLLNLLLKSVLMGILTYGYGLLGACIGMVISELLFALLVRFGLRALAVRLRMAGPLIAITSIAVLLVALCSWLGVSSWLSVLLIFSYLAISLFFFNRVIRGIKVNPGRESGRSAPKPELK